jgi:paraquat-inducible protein B
VASYALDEDGKSLDIKVFVRAPYDQYVTPNTRFWQASGIDLSLTAVGLSVQTQSLRSILVGGIAFETVADAPPLPPADADATFTLYGNRSDAFKLPARFPHSYEVVFEDSVRGLAPGAPVEFRGIPIGEVASVEAKVNAKTFEFSAPVLLHIDAQKLGVKIEDLAPGASLETIRRQLIDTLVAHGVRAQLQTGNLLTGSLFVMIDFFPDAPPATIDWSREPVRLPTIPGQLEAMEAKVGRIIDKIDHLPLKEIGEDLRKTIVELDRTLASARQAVDNANKLIEPNSVLGAELGSTLQEVSRAARGLRVLADYLERHPEALIRGKTGDAK